MYDHERFSNSATTARLVATQPIPASAPAAMPHHSVVAGPARNIARFADMINARTNAPPKARALLKPRAWASVKPLALSQTLPNKMGEYHNPPTKKVDNAATRIASQLIWLRFILPLNS